VNANTSSLPASWVSELEVVRVGGRLADSRAARGARLTGLVVVWLLRQSKSQRETGDCSCTLDACEGASQALAVRYPVADVKAVVRLAVWLDTAVDHGGCHGYMRQQT
jgi:hypothetical protein